MTNMDDKSEMYKGPLNQNVGWNDAISFYELRIW